jgi:transposase
LPFASRARKDALIAQLLGRVDALTRQVEGLSARVQELESANEVLRAENAMLRAENAALREKLKLPPKTPDNSSMPPSRGQKANGEPSRKSKATAHTGAHRPLHPNPTRTRDVRAKECPQCRADVSGVAQSVVHVYDRIEIPEIKPDVTQVRLHGGTCPCCARRFTAAAPAGLEPGSPFGPNLRALAIYLRYTQAISFERLARLMSDLLGVAISEGALVNILDDSRAAFAREAERIRERLLSSTILQSDETSVRVGKRTWWTWVFHHDRDCCFVIRPSRGKDVVADFLGEHRPDIWVSDRLAAQMGWATRAHQVCLAHLIRDAQHAIDAGDTAFAPGLKKLLQRACGMGARRPDLAHETLRSYASKLNTRLDDLLRRAPTHALGEKLHAAIKACRQHLFVFLADRAVPPTNNGSEQGLRPCVTYRKVTNGFRSEWGAKLYADIRSVVETARRRAISALDAIRLTLAGSALPGP